MGSPLNYAQSDDTISLWMHLMISERRKEEDFSLEALRAGDRAEFARLVEAYSGVIYRLGLKMLDDPQDAEDVLQETFIKAYRHLKNFDGRSSLSTWLYRIGTNEALMLIRKRKNLPLSIDEPAAGRPGNGRAVSDCGLVLLARGRADVWRRCVPTWTKPLNSSPQHCGQSLS